MAEKGETKILTIVTICIILFSILFSGCIDNNNKEKKLPGGHYEYILKLNVSKEDNYNCLVPFPFLDNGSPFSAYDNIRFEKGMGLITIKNTTYGNALLIVADESIIIKADIEGCTLVDLSMFAESKSLDSSLKYWINFNSSTIEKAYIEIKSNSNNWVENTKGEIIGAGDSYYYSIKDDITLGWQKVNATYNSIIYD